MLEVLNLIWSKIASSGKKVLIVLIISPLLFSIILYLLSLINVEVIDPRLKNYSIIVWLLSFIFFILISLIFSFFCHRNKEFKENKSRIFYSIDNLLKYRLKGERLFLNIGLAIFTFYVLAFFPILIRYYEYNVYTSSLIFFAFLFLFLFSIILLVNIFLGLQEKKLTRYFIVFPLFIVWFVYYIITLIESLPINFTDDFNFTTMLGDNVFWLIPTIITVLVTFFLGKEKIKRNLPRRVKAGWINSFYPFALVTVCFLCLALLINLLIIGISLSILSISNFSNMLELLAIFVAMAIISDLYICFLVLSYPSSLFIKNMMDWSKFFECYNGPSIRRLGVFPKKLIKISGKCRAVSINEKYRERYEEFNQHFLLEIDDSKEEIDVISLEETNPLISTQFFVRESDEINVVGEIKSVLDDESLFSNDNRISDLILAYHVEPKISESPKKEMNKKHKTKDDKKILKKYEPTTKEIDGFLGKNFGKLRIWRRKYNETINQF